MLHYAVVFLAIAVIVGALGLGGLAASAITKILFFTLLSVFVLSPVSGRQAPV